MAAAVKLSKTWSVHDGAFFAGHVRGRHPRAPNERTFCESHKQEMAMQGACEFLDFLELADNISARQIAQLVTMLPNIRADDRRRVFYIFCNLEPEVLTPALGERLLRSLAHNDWGVRRLVVDIVSAQPILLLPDLLIELCEHDDWGARACALEALGTVEAARLLGPQHIKALLALTERHDDFEVRRGAERILRSMDHRTLAAFADADEKAKSPATAASEQAIRRIPSGGHGLAAGIMGMMALFNASPPSAR